LPQPDSVPEYNDATWFTMLFSCGVSTGLFFFGVAEPILHYTGKNRQVKLAFQTGSSLFKQKARFSNR
jgi:choline-glycine betaine transporter